MFDLGLFTNVPIQMMRKKEKKSLYTKIWLLINYHSIQSFRRFQEFWKILPTFTLNGRFSIIWNFLKIFIFIFLLLIIPVDIGFNYDFVKNLVPNNTQFFKSVFIISSALDIFFKLHTEIYVKGEVSNDKFEIAKEYFNNIFIYDGIALIGNIFWIINAEWPYNLFSLLYYFKLMQVIKSIDDIMESSLLSTKLQGIYSLFSLGFKILFISHVTACFWIGTHVYNYNEIDSPITWVTQNSFDLDTVSPLITQSFQKQYLVSFYWAVTTIVTVGYGDISPKNSVEVIFTIGTILVGCGVFAYSLNSVGNILNDISKEEREYKYYLKKLNFYMNSKKISGEIQTKVRKYLSYVWKEEQSYDDIEKNLMSKLSDNLKFEMEFDSKIKILKKIKVLTSNFSEEFLMQLNMSIDQQKFTPNEIIFEEKEEVSLAQRQLYFISSGEVGITSTCFKKKEKPFINKLKKDQEFGLMSFFTGQQEDYTARSFGYTTIYTIGFEDFLEIIQQFPEDYEKFCYLRDQIQIEKNFRLINVKCYSCGSSSHLYKFCPYFQYKRNILQSLKREDFYNTHKRKKFNRKNQSIGLKRQFFKMEEFPDDISPQLRNIKEIQQYAQSDEDHLGSSSDDNEKQSNISLWESPDKIIQQQNSSTEKYQVYDKRLSKLSIDQYINLKSQIELEKHKQDEIQNFEDQFETVKAFKIYKPEYNVEIIVPGSKEKQQPLTHQNSSKLSSQIGSQSRTSMKRRITEKFQAEQLEVQGKQKQLKENWFKKIVKKNPTFKIKE